MPSSKNRKSHAKKVKSRNIQIANHKRHIDKLYSSLYEELRNKSTSVPDMLNNEEKAGVPNSPDQTTLPT